MQDDAAPNSPLPPGIVRGPQDGAGLVLIPASCPPDDIALSAGAEMILAASGTATGRDPMLFENQILDADLAQRGQSLRCQGPTIGWVLGFDHPGWHLEHGHTGFLRQDEAEVETPMEAIVTSSQDDGGFPLRAGAAYQFSALLGVHRCSAAVVVRLLDEHGAQLREITARPPLAVLGGTKPADYAAVVAEFTAAPGEVSAQLLLRKHNTLKGTDSWFFFTRLWFGRVPHALGKPAGWQPAQYSQDELAALQLLDVSGITEWRVQLPQASRADGSSLVEVTQRSTGMPLVNSPLEGDAHAIINGMITGLDGTTVTGWAVDMEEPDIALDVVLFIDNQRCGSGRADHPSGDAFHGFRLPVPPAFLDGQAHRIAVRLARNDALVAEIAEIIPSQMTPWQALVRHAGAYLPARLSTAAAYRYESLRLQLLAADPATTNLRQIYDAHERVLGGLDRVRNLPALSFPQHESPRVSIVIPVHNKFHVTHNCLAALLLAYNRTSFEVIIADDGSSDDTKRITETVSGIKYCRHQTAEGFVTTCNMGAAMAAGEYVLLLNNDTEPTSHWLDELIWAFENYDQVGMAGSKLLYADGRLQEAGGIIWGDGSAWNYGRNQNPADPRFSYTRQADYLSGAAIMLPRRLWDELGGLSDEFRPAYYEDTDLAFKVRQAGLKTIYVSNSVVFHFEGISSGTSTSSGMKRFQEVNRPKFLRKWRHAYRVHGTDIARADIEKDRGTSLRMLFIDAQPPRPDNDAGGYAAVQEMRMMQALGAKVTFLPENLAYLGDYISDLQRGGVEVIYAPFALSVDDFLRARGSEFDVVYITRYMVAERHLNSVRTYAPQAKILFCNADLHFLRELREAIGQGSNEGIAAAMATRESELQVMRNVDLTLSYNEVEHAVIMSHNLDATRVVTCPWVVDVAASVPGFEQRRDIAFLGGFGHPPNAEAVKFFVREVMPLLRAANVGARFIVYGSGVGEDILALAGEDVIIHGYVEHVRDVFTTCRVFVAPLQSGAGLKGKVADALSFGIPSVLSPIAAEGVGLSDGTDALIAQTPKQWADAITQLYSNPQRWAEVSQAALSFAGRRFSLERGVAMMRDALESLGLYTDQGVVTRTARFTLGARPAPQAAPPSAPAPQLAEDAVRIPARKAR